LIPWLATARRVALSDAYDTGAAQPSPNPRRFVRTSKRCAGAKFLSMFDYRL
jgi:hypothetical protein